jgi:hypothetical protein
MQRTGPRVLARSSSAHEHVAASSPPAHSGRSFATAAEASLVRKFCMQFSAHQIEELNPVSSLNASDAYI